jgi:hypothetical protein
LFLNFFVKTKTKKTINKKQIRNKKKKRGRRAIENVTHVTALPPPPPLLAWASHHYLEGVRVRVRVNQNKEH